MSWIEDNKGSGPWTLRRDGRWKISEPPFNIDPITNKRIYNIGSELKTSANPVWHYPTQGAEPVTPTHSPCGYWYRGDAEVVLPPTPPAPEEGPFYAAGRDNLCSQLGFGGASAIITFTLISVDLCMYGGGGRYHSVVLQGDGTLWSVGNNGNGELGLGDTIDRSYFTEVSGGWSSIQSGCDGWHTLAIKEDKSLWGTGANSGGQLGLGDNVGRTVFTEIGIIDWQKVSCGRAHSAAINEDGYLYATGGNYYGQLGIGSPGPGSNRNEFSRLATWPPIFWKEVACGEYHTLAIRDDGTLWSTGYNNYGQLGLSDDINRSSFTQVGSDLWLKVSCGDCHSVAIKEDGTLWGTGQRSYGQLGDDAIYNRETPILIDSGSWKEVSCGQRHTCAIKSDDTLWVTGNNDYGQLGLGGGGTRRELTQVGTEKCVNINCTFWCTFVGRF